jgi:hypothetical protein
MAANINEKMCFCIFSNYKNWHMVAILLKIFVGILVKNVAVEIYLLKKHTFRFLKNSLPRLIPVSLFRLLWRILFSKSALFNLINNLVFSDLRPF